MSQSLKDAASLHTDKDEMKVISPTVKSSDETGQKNDKASDKSYDEPPKRVSENLETSSTSSKINDTSQGKEKEIPLHQAQR